MTTPIGELRVLTEKVRGEVRACSDPEARYAFLRLCHLIDRLIDRVDMLEATVASLRSAPATASPTLLSEDATMPPTPPIREAFARNVEGLCEFLNAGYDFHQRVPVSRIELDHADCALLPALAEVPTWRCSPYPMWCGIRVVKRLVSRIIVEPPSDL